MEKLWDMERIINKSRVVYIGLDSLTDSIVGSSLGSLLLADLACVAGARYNYGEQINKVNIFVDESSEVINEQLIQILNKGRGAGFRVVAAAQTVADFETRLGSKAKAMQALGNFNNLISLRIIDKETREYVANSFPKVRIKYRNQNVTYSSNSSNISQLNHTISDSEQEVEASTFPVEMFAEIPDLEFIARVGGATIYKGKIPFIIE
jgi:conjugal transfer pilus assembly protein TraD